jgi:cell division protein FtsI (penicillin-binding protein 3)
VVTSFAGVFPMNEPRYVMVMMLDDPKAKETYGFHTAAWNIGPAFGATVSRIAPMLGVRPDKNREPDMSIVLPFVHEEARH